LARRASPWIRYGHQVPIG